ncbi:MAG: hypothetical protein ACRCV6_06600 [Formosimonas sp.]
MPTIPRFTTEQCDAVFAAVLIDDVIDPSTRLPEKIHLDYSHAQLMECFYICQQVWELGVNRHDFSRLTQKIYRQRDLDATDRLTYKHVRAKFKQLRFAFANFDESHKYPRAFHAITSLMGYVQDNFKLGERGKTGRGALALRLFLSKLPYALVERELKQFKPCSVESFQKFVYKGVNFIRDKISKEAITAHEFHSIRKIISRQASFYVALVVLYPSDYHNDVFRHLSAINGMMGRMHDDLVEKELNGAQDYHADTFAIPDDIKQLLSAVVGAF